MLTKKTLCSLGIVVGLLCSGLQGTSVTIAADHQHASSAAARKVSNTGDYYAWHEGDMLNLVLTLGPLTAAESAVSYASDIVYALHFDTSNPTDGKSDIDLYARFAQNTHGMWDVQVTGTDGATLEAPIGTLMANEHMSIWAGRADGPFFFDQSGFNNSISTGFLSFNPENEDVSGLNLGAVAIQIPTRAIAAEGDSFQTWASTHTIGRTQYEFF